jgi:hypothetical protein
MPLNQNMTEHQLHELYDNVKRLREAITSVFSLYTSIALASVNGWMTKDGGTILPASEALTKTIINEVREFTIPQGVQIITIGNA